MSDSDVENPPAVPGIVRQGRVRVGMIPAIPGVLYHPVSVFYDDDTFTCRWFGATLNANTLGELEEWVRNLILERTRPPADAGWIACYKLVLRGACDGSASAIPAPPATMVFQAVTCELHGPYLARAVGDRLETLVGAQVEPTILRWRAARLGAWAPPCYRTDHNPDDPESPILILWLPATRAGVAVALGLLDAVGAQTAWLTRLVRALVEEARTPPPEPEWIGLLRAARDLIDQMGATVMQQDITDLRLTARVLDERLMSLIQRLNVLLNVTSQPSPASEQIIAVLNWATRCDYVVWDWMNPGAEGDPHA